MLKRSTQSIAAAVILLISLLLIALFVSSPLARRDRPAPTGYAFYRIPLNRLNITEGPVPTLALQGGPWAQPHLVPGPRTTLDGAIGEAYVDVPEATPSTRPTDQATLLIRAPAGRDLKGRLFLPDPNGQGMAASTFTIPASAAEASAREPFYRHMQAHYQRLWERGIPGSPWFRHQAMKASEALANAEPTDQALPLPPNRLNSTFSLFGPSRNITESLPITGTLAVGADAALVSVDSIQGVPSQAADWNSQEPGSQTQADPLASHIPADQHAIFFPGFPALVTALDEADHNAQALLPVLEPRAEDGRILQQYQRQLCLPINTLNRLVGPRVIGTVAMTGSDPYLHIGSDVAVLFEAKDMAVLQKLLMAQVVAAQQSSPQVQRVDGTLNGLPYQGFRSPDRFICSYSMKLGSAMVVSNSLAQLQRLVEAYTGKRPAMASAGEYRFFRARYTAGSDSETAFFIMPEAAIARWCSPRWRIADSRRARAAAILGHIQAEHLDTLARNAVPADTGDTAHPQLGQLRLTPHGVTSSIYGSLAFMTPILEMNVDTVTQQEAEAYGQWRDAHKGRLSSFITPLAARIAIQQRQLAVDATLAPWTPPDRLAPWLSVARGGHIAPDHADRPSALAQAALAINKDSPPIRRLGDLSDLLGRGIRIDVLGWLGPSISIHVDDDPLWRELPRARSIEAFLEQNIGRLPWAIQAEVTSAWRLRLALAAGRALADARSPQAIEWNDLHHNGQAYVRIRTQAPPAAGQRLPRDLVLYYAAMPDALVISPNEAVLKRAIDRNLAQTRPNQDNGSSSPDRPWLGSSFCLQVDRKAVDLARTATARQYHTLMQQRVWDAIPILNEWKRLYPAQDPLAMHEKLWHTRLRCPGGGTYVWNEQWQTMESAAYGHPAAPKPGSTRLPIVEDYLFGNAGLDVEKHGLRLRLVLDRQPGGQ